MGGVGVGLSVTGSGGASGVGGQEKVVVGLRAVVHWELPAFWTDGVVWTVGVGRVTSATSGCFPVVVGTYSLEVAVVDEAKDVTV